MTENIDPEYATVGALLLAPAELVQVAGWLRPEDFTRPVCGEVYGVVLRLAGEDRPVDAVSVLAELRRAGRVRRDGYPVGELTRMVDAVASPLSVGYYARLVVEAAVFRRLEQAGKRLVQAGTSRRGEVDDAFRLLHVECVDLLAVRRRFAQADTAAPAGGPVRLGSLVRDFIVDGHARPGPVRER